MGYASRNNPINQDLKNRKLKPYNPERDLMDRINHHFGTYHGARVCYGKGLITFKKMKEIQLINREQQPPALGNGPDGIYGIIAKI